MDYQRPDSEQGAPQGTVENDFIRPLKPMKSISHRRLPAALPFAIAGLLVVTSVAFGATVIRQSITPPPNPSAVVVGDDDPTATPTLVVTDAPTEAPTLTVTAAPVVTPVPNLVLTAGLSGTKVKLSWSAFQGDNFAFYKVVRSTDATPAWPLGAGDTLVAAISNIGQLSYTDAAPLGKTFRYAVFAVKSADDGYAVLVGSNVVSIATPKPTPAPTKNCGITLSASVIAPPAPTDAPVDTAAPANVHPTPTPTSGYKVRLTWTRYNCDNFQWYGVQKENNGTPTLKIGDIPNFFYNGNQNGLTTTDVDVQLGQTYSYRAYAFTEKSLATTGGIQPACYATTILAISNIVTVTIPS